jgi:hypothetical protein
MANNTKAQNTNLSNVNTKYTSGLYKAQAQPNSFAHGSSFAAKLLEPAGNGVVDVIRAYRWTAGEIPSDFVKNETPYIHLREFRYLRTGAELLAVAMLSNNTLNAVADTNPYANLYNYDDPTKFEYIFPFFTSDYYDVNNSFRESNAEQAASEALGAAGEAANSIVSKLKSFGGKLGAAGFAGDGAMGVGGVVKNVASAANSYAGFANNLKSVAGGDGKLDVPQVWDNTAPRQISFSFYLFNTYSVNDIKQNWELIHLLRYQNIMNKLTMVNAIPPVFYEVTIPGVHYSLASYISNLKIENIGASRCFMASDVNLPGAQVLIPDAFKVSLTITDFLKPSQNMIQELLTGNNNIAITRIKPEASKIIQAAGDILETVASVTTPNADGVINRLTGKNTNQP